MDTKPRHPIRPPCSIQHWLLRAILALTLALAPLLAPSGAWGVDLDPTDPSGRRPYPIEKLEHLAKRLASLEGDRGCWVAWGKGTDFDGMYGHLPKEQAFLEMYANTDALDIILKKPAPDAAAFFCANWHKFLEDRGVDPLFANKMPKTALIFRGQPSCLTVHHERWHRVDFLCKKTSHAWGAAEGALHHLGKLEAEEFVHGQLMRFGRVYSEAELTNQMGYIRYCRIKGVIDALGQDFNGSGGQTLCYAPPKAGTASDPIPTTGRVVGRTPLPGPAPRACIPKVAAAPMAWAGENILQDLCEAEPNSGLSQGMGGIGQAASWCDRQLGNAPSSAAQYCGRKVSDAASWCAGDLSNQRKVESEAAASQIPVMRPAPPWYRRSPFGWGREMWKGGQQWCRGIARDGLW